MSIVAKLTDEQKAEIDAYLHEQNEREGLAPKQKWEVAKIVSSVIVGFAAILGLGGAFIVSESADRAAGAWTVSQLAAKVTNNEAFLARLDQGVPIPNGMVAAFDMEEGCPIGWMPFERAYGRFLIGAGGKEDGPIARSFRETGGEAIHLLTVEEMPAHKHDTGFISLLLPEFLAIDTSKADNQRALRIDDPRTPFGVHMPYFADGSSAVAEGRTDSVTYPKGEGLPHNNMPPYIALYFCKYEGAG